MLTNNLFGHNHRQKEWLAVNFAGLRRIRSWGRASIKLPRGRAARPSGNAARKPCIPSGSRPLATTAVNHHRSWNDRRWREAEFPPGSIAWL